MLVVAGANARERSPNKDHVCWRNSRAPVWRPAGFAGNADTPEQAPSRCSDQQQVCTTLLANTIGLGHTPPAIAILAIAETLLDLHPYLIQPHDLLGDG